MILGKWLMFAGGACCGIGGTALALVLPMAVPGMGEVSMIALANMGMIALAVGVFLVGLATLSAMGRVVSVAACHAVADDGEEVTTSLPPKYVPARRVQPLEKEAA